MSHFNNIKVKKVENSNRTSRGAVIFSLSSHENHENISHFYYLGINYCNLVCLSLIFEAIMII